MHSPLYHLTRARLLEFLREPGAVFWTFGFPILLTIALGIAFRTEAPPAQRIAILDGPNAASLARQLAGSSRLAPEVMSADAADRALHAAEVVLVVEAAGSTGDVHMRFDPSRPDAASARLLVSDTLQRAAGRQDRIRIVDEPVVAPGSRYVDWLVPGLLGTQLMSGSLWGIAYVIVQTRQRKLLKRLVATPMSKRDYLLSFMLGRFVFLVVEVPSLLIFAHFAFGVAIRGSTIDILLVSVLGAGAFAGLGLLCASRAENSETANGLVNLITLPMFVLSGVFFSAAKFPGVLQPVIRALPLTTLNEALRAIINDGSGLASVLPQLVNLTLWGVVSFALALRLFRWT